MFETILLPVDGSEPSKRAVRVATDLAKSAGGEVVVLHVKERQINRFGVFDLEATELVDATVRQIKDFGVSARGEVTTATYGRATREILEMADATGADIIVM